MLTLNQVSVKYGKKKVIRNITTTINDGEVVLLAGRNGAGKTTLLKTIMGLLPLSCGEVLINGKIPRKSYDNIAYITDRGAFTFQSAEEYGHFLESFYPHFSYEQYKKILDFMEIPSAKQIGKLSKGQHTKLELAAGFAKNADIMLMDEPFLGKDIFSKIDMIKYMAATIKEYQTVIIATHDISEVENFVDRLMLIEEGSLKSDVQIDRLREEGYSLLEYMQEAVGYDSEKYKEYMV